MTGPTSSGRVGFWLLLGVTSRAFAEVLFPTTAFDLGTMAVFAVPVYLLHSVVLAAPVLGVTGAPPELSSQRENPAVVGLSQP
jgi:Na+/melibiose symporter-like transporter